MLGDELDGVRGEGEGPIGREGVQGGDGHFWKGKEEEEKKQASDGLDDQGEGESI